MAPNLAPLLGHLWLHTSAGVVLCPTAVGLCSHCISGYLAHGLICAEQLALRFGAGRLGLSHSRSVMLTMRFRFGVVRACLQMTGDEG